MTPIVQMGKLRLEMIGRLTQWQHNKTGEQQLWALNHSAALKEACGWSRYAPDGTGMHFQGRSECLVSRGIQEAAE